MTTQTQWFLPNSYGSLSTVRKVPHRRHVDVYAAYPSVALWRINIRIAWHLHAEQLAFRYY